MPREEEPPAPTGPDPNLVYGVRLGVKALLTVVLGTVVFYAGCPYYKVYEKNLEGQALLRKAESERQVQIEDAKSKEQAAKMLANAEIERARGVAEANRIIGTSLKDNPEYLTYLWIKEVNADGNAVIYIPTEAGIPILEAGRTIAKPKPEPKAEPKK